MEDHSRLVEHILKLQGMVLLSCYDDPVYAPLREAGWSKHQWQTVCYAAGRTRATGIQGAGSATRMQPRSETLYVSPRAVMDKQEQMNLVCGGETND